jgi:hypothetical protein
MNPMARRLPVELEFKAAAAAHPAAQQRRKVIASAFWPHGEKIQMAILKAEHLRLRPNAGIRHWRVLS